MRLRTKYALVLLATTLVLSAGLYGGLELYKDELVRQTQAEVDETAELTAGQLDTVVRERKDFVGFVASRPEASNFDDGGAYLAEVVDNSRFFAGQLVAADGTIVAFHGDVTGAIQDEAIGRDVSDRRYVQVALEGETYVSELERANATGDWVAIISAPVFSDREVVGVLAVATFVDEPTFFPMVAPVETSDQAVVVRDGEKVLYGDDAAAPAAAIEATAKAEETGWTVRVARNRAPLNAQLELLALFQGLGLLVVLVGMVGFAGWQYRTSLQQIDRLLAGFGALEAGAYDHELSLETADEWQDISAGFNAMGSALETRERELRQRQQRLEVLNRVLRHNLRNSAGVLLGYGQKVEEQAADPGLARAGALIVSRVRELASLGETARELEQTLEGSEEPPRPVEAVAVVEAVLEEQRTAHPGVLLEADLPASAWVAATPALERTVEHVVRNACEHNDADEPRVTVAVEPAGPGGGRVAIRVADNGPGIPDHELAVLLEGRETPLQHGSGLGLWLVHWTVERFGGAVRFEEDDGAVVTIELDAVPADRMPTEDVPLERDADSAVPRAGTTEATGPGAAAAVASVAVEATDRLDAALRAAVESAASAADRARSVVADVAPRVTGGGDDAGAAVDRPVELDAWLGAAARAAADGSWAETGTPDPEETGAPGSPIDPREEGSVDRSRARERGASVDAGDPEWSWDSR